jgi:hypothetical protein
MDVINSAYGEQAAGSAPAGSKGEMAGGVSNFAVVAEAVDVSEPGAEATGGEGMMGFGLCVVQSKVRKYVGIIHQEPTSTSPTSTVLCFS